jgi:hypothetical protein
MTKRNTEKNKIYENSSFGFFVSPLEILVPKTQINDAISPIIIADIYFL